MKKQVSNHQVIKELPIVPRSESIRTVFDFVKNPIPFLTKYSREYGPTFIHYLAGVSRGVVSIEPEFAQQVLQKGHRTFTKSELQTQQLAKFAGHGLLTSDGDYWLRQRRLIQPGFHRDKLAALTTIMQKVIDESMQEIAVECKDGSVEIDVGRRMMKIAFRVVARSLFGSDIPESELEVLGESIVAIQDYFIRKIRQPFLVPWYYVSGTNRQYMKIAERSKSIILKVIAERKASNKEHHDLLDMLLSARYKDTGEGMTDQQLLDECLILFVAGHETSANALTWTTYLLSQHDTERRRLQEEISRVLDTQSPSFTNIPKLTYTKQIVEESMRLYPPAWITDRMAREDAEVAGYQVPKSSNVIPFIYGIHHNPKYWPEPEKFDPERFSPEQSEGRHSFAYMPFGGGPRLCIGSNFAMMEMQMIVVALFRQFDFELVSEAPLLSPLITLRPRTPIKMRVKMR